MANGIGDTLAEAPTETQPNSALDFLKKPENLATALVLAAALTNRRKPGQSRLNQGLTAGVGALAFRGGLEKGVQGQRADLRAEELEATESASKIAQGKDQNAILRERNRIAEQGLTTPRPLNESEITLNEANAGLRDAQAANVGKVPVEPIIPETFATLFQKNKELAASTTLPGQSVDLAKVATDTNRELILTKVFTEGRVFPNGDLDLTDEEAATLGIVPLAPVEPVDPKTGKPKAKVAPKREEDLTLSGQQLRGITPHTVNFVRAETLRIARREGVFEGVSDDDVFATIARVRAEAQDPKLLEAKSAQELQDIADVYRDILAPKELRNLRTAIRHATRTRAPSFSGIK